MRRKQRETDPPIRPQLYVSVMLVMLILILVFTGLWDWALAVFLALLVGNGLTALWPNR